MKRYLLVTTLSLTSFFSEACSKKDSSDTPAGATDEVELINTLAVSYPQTLALSVFPQTATSLRAEEEENPYQDMNVKEKVEENRKVLKGEVDDCIPPNLFGNLKQRSPVTCYEFDSDMNPSKFSGQTQEFGTVDGTDGNGEACLVAFTRAEVKDAVDTVDRALALVAGLLCQAKKDGLATTPPEAGADALDLSDSLEKATHGFMTAEKAEVARLDDIDGHPVFRTDIVVKDPNDKPMEVHLVHSPGEGEGAKGTLWFLHHPPAGPGGNDPNNSANKNFAMSINYERTKDDAGETRMRYEVRRAAIVNTIEPFTEDGLVNYAGIPENANNDTVHAINYVAFDMNPEDNSGNLSYWQNPGGNFNESARGFLFNVEADDEGKLKGCGISGATSDISVRKSLGSPDDFVLEPTRYWHPRGDQNIHPDKDSRYPTNEGPMITEQCFAQDEEGVYAIDTAKTAHERGYEVIAGSDTAVRPPHRPEGRLEGEFNKPQE